MASEPIQPPSSIKRSIIRNITLLVGVKLLGTFPVLPVNDELKVDQLAQFNSRNGGKLMVVHGFSLSTVIFSSEERISAN